MPVSDRWLLARLAHTVARATAAMEEYEAASARAVVERFFWDDFCDTYLELVKFRLLQPGDPRERDSAVHTARASLLAVLKMLAPYLPHVTEELYLAAFAETEGAASVHVSAWPDAGAYPADHEAEQAGVTMLDVVDMVRRWKAARNLSVGAPVALVSITAPTALVPLLQDMDRDLRSITRADRMEVAAGEAVAVVVEARAAPP